MGAKTWFAAWIEPKVEVRKLLQSLPKSDAGRARTLAASLYPKARVRTIGEGSLAESLNPPDNELYVGCFPGLTIVATRELGGDHPSKTDARFRPNRPGVVVVHAMHSVVDFFALGVWENGTLRRALSLSPDGGVMEDAGARYSFEEPYWGGERPVGDDYALPFHPLDLAEDALRAFFGFALEGKLEDGDPETFDITLSGFRTT